MTDFVVGTGIRKFPVKANTPKEAIQKLKVVMDKRLTEYDPDLSFGLAEANKKGKLNFVVFDPEESTIVAGEYQGEFECPVSPKLLDALVDIIPEQARKTAEKETKRVALPVN